ncbi:hypothetical protein BGAL_0727g00020 [Botrytis galanthina]|uniref:Helicase C-terminal domain-containing protein n=1 Tax=Botrytis galanthina TaxID=278940 RepID=A0A4S8QM26_9HELO|nr:hypothetical protein BGAL_0727g00020 [Botrytis galanthina]
MGDSSSDSYLAAILEYSFPNISPVVGELGCYEDYIKNNLDYCKPTKKQNMTAAKLADLIASAASSNPKGVLVVNFKNENAAHVAGYLGFQDNVVLTKWIEEEQHLPKILTPWYTAKQTSFGCPVKNAGKPAEKDFSTKNLFKEIGNLDPRLTSFVTGDTFPITWQMLGLKKSEDQPGYLCNLHAMHLIIKTYPDHFPEDNPMSPNELHSRENWNRAWYTLKSYWSAHNKLAAGARTKNLPRREAIVPLYMDSAAASIDTTPDEATAYLLFKQDEYSDFFNMKDGIISSTGKTKEEVEEENVREAEGFHAELNKTGDIQKEANRRVIEGKKKIRPLIKPEELTVWLEGLAKHFKNFTTSAKVVRGPEKNDPDEVPMFKESMEFSEVLETVEGLSKSDQEKVANGKKEFFELLEKMSSASAVPKSFVDSCKAHGIDYRDPKNIVIEGTNLKPYPHQVIDMAWLAEMEESAFGGGILASECGSGKTVVILLLILMVHRKLTVQGSKDHFATLIIVPSAVIDVWFADFMKFFSKALICRIFYGRPGNLDPQRAKCFVGTHIKDLEKELEALDVTNPDTSRTFYLTSYTTFAKRAMRIKKAYRKGRDIDGEINYMSDENEIDDLRDENEEMDDQLLKKYELGFSHYGKFGRIVPDEAHIIKNPCTLTADVIYKCQIKRIVEPSATPMINHIRDARGLLIQLLKVKELPLNLPKTLKGLLSMYDPNFNPRHDLPKEENAVSILPPLSEDEQIVKLHKAADDGIPLHILCPKAFLAVGNQSNWDANAARIALRPILQNIQRKRLMSNTFETIDGRMETPGNAIPHYTVKTVNLRMPKLHQELYDESTFECVKQQNSGATITMNMEAYRGLQLASFDGQLIELVQRKVKEVPAGTAKEVASWYDLDDDHGITYKYYRTRPSDGWYIPPPTNRLAAAATAMGLSPKLRAIVLQVAEWRAKGERCLLFLNWPMSQWATEGVLHLLGFKIMSILSAHKAEDRRKAIEAFNDPKHDVDVMLIGFKIGSYGLNFHHACSKMIIAEYPTSIDILLHVFGRLHRLGQKKVQEIIILFLENSFDGWIRNKMSEKFVNKLLAEGRFDGADSKEMQKEARGILANLLGEDDISGVSDDPHASG